MPGDRLFPPGKFWQLCGTELWEGRTLRFPTYQILEGLKPYHLCGGEGLPQNAATRCRLGLPVWKLYF